LRRAQDALSQQARVLQSVSYERVLARGFALVTRADGALVRTAAGVADGDALRLRFADAEVVATAGASLTVSPRPETAPAAEQTQRPRIRRRMRSEDDQGNLF
jgi:exodeoxyribonuclease VII large subunit